MIRFFLDQCLPPIVRDSRWFYAPIIKIFDPKLDVDFKSHLPSMTDKQLRNEYDRLAQLQMQDLSPEIIKYVLDQIKGDNILEVGCGMGTISIACAERKHSVVATDVSTANMALLNERIAHLNLPIIPIIASADHLPFPDQSFDVTLCLHTLEHVRYLPETISELKRVTRQRLIIVVPRERYNRYTCHYHLHYFWDIEQLLLIMQIPNARCAVVHGDICFIGEIAPTRVL